MKKVCATPDREALIAPLLTPAMVRVRRFATATLGATYVLMLLGLYTAGTSSGLSCGAQWPLCGGGPLGLFPPNWFSFVEWAHRLVAMLTGVAILGLGVVAWRRAPRLRVPVTVAVALLPLQVGIGALTVTFGGLIPGGFSPPVQVSHFSVALTIFALLVVTALRAHDREGGPGTGVVRRGALVALAAAPLVVLFGRGIVFTYTAPVQAVSYGAGLAAFAALLAVALRARGPTRALAAGTLAVLVVQLLLGRGLLLFTGWVVLAYLAVTVLVGAGIGAVAWSATRERARAVGTATAD
jgi:cytochrome c oxidase assembly protein subunit 15